MTTLLKTIIEPCLFSQPETIWADPSLVLAMIKEQLADLNRVSSNDSGIILACWNAEYLWQAKADHFFDTYQEIISRHHLLAMQEVSPRGLALLGQASGYNHIVSQPNNRGQAVGFLIHPRFAVSNIVEYTQLTKVYGIYNLRPALRVDLIDSRSNTALSVITLHLKSMLGGLPSTSPIRIKQLHELMAALADNQYPTIIAGDFNCLLDTSADIDPLLNNGYQLANKNNHTSTQCGGGRLDGLFHKNLSAQLRPKHYNIRNFWRSSLAGRSLSDHGLLTWQLGG